jgi:flagellar operon protein
MKVSDLQMRANLQPLKNNKNIQVPNQNQTDKSSAAGVNFADILQEKVDATNMVQFSSHAIKRLEERSLMISQDDINRLNDGVRQLDAKGSKNSLVMVDDTAFVVSVRNKTVITAMDKVNTESNIFTNIDSVAFV